MKRNKKPAITTERVYISVYIPVNLKEVYEKAAIKDRRSTSALMALTLEQHQPKDK